MAQLYDSTKVREAARAMRALRDSLEDGAMEPQRRALRESEPLKGAAAEAMRERILLLEQDLKKSLGELDAISAELNRYAGALEEVGEKLIREMQ
ncbi:MAG: hypothetical protein IJ124_10475 [Clostridia bacterium]|nr:hypothetical protein [Clostridia bacterium]MBQ9719742.1 hypothetical protein [Oscillospiraceae bacterium]